MDVKVGGDGLSDKGRKTTENRETASRKVGICLQMYIVSKPRTTTLSSSPP
jgi:hypothetical protein